MIAVFTGFTFAVDVPDRTDYFNGLAISASGAAIAFAAPFNGGPASSPVPIWSGAAITPAGAVVSVTNVTTTNATVQLMLGGVAVAGTANIAFEGY